MSEFEMETVRPTTSLIKDVFGDRISEVWIFNDCAIVEMKDDTFCALIVRRFTSGPYKGATYYGFIPMLRAACSQIVRRSSTQSRPGIT